MVIDHHDNNQDGQVNRKAITLVMTRRVTLLDVAGSRVPLTEHQARRLRDCLVSALEARESGFTEAKGWQDRAAPILGISQALISAIYNRRRRDYAVSTLLKLRAFCGRSLDDMLGFDDDADTRLRRIVREEMGRGRSRAPSEPPPSTSVPHVTHIATAKRR